MARVVPRVVAGLRARFLRAGLRVRLGVHAFFAAAAVDGEAGLGEPLADVSVTSTVSPVKALPATSTWPS